MKKQIAYIYKLFLIMILTGVVASCSFWSDSIEEKETTTSSFVTGGGSSGSKGTFTVTGTISLSEGAFPASIINASKGKRSSRAAVPGIPTELTYSVIASDGENEVAGEETDPTNHDYQINGLEFGKAWTVSVVIKDSYEMPVLSDTWTIPEDNTEANLFHRFWVKPATSSSGTGTLSLTIVLNNDLDGIVSKVTAECKSVENMDDWEASVTPNDDIEFVDNTPVSISVSDNVIASGQYEVSFNFYNEEHVLVYNTVQTINVFDNLTTNTWVSGNSSGPIKSDGTFELTKALVNGYAKTHLYVGNTHFTESTKTDDINGTGTAAKPFASVTGAIDYLKKVGSSEKDYTIYVVGQVTGEQKIIDTITDDGNGNETVTTIPARSITIEGFKGLNEGIPQDTLDGGFTGYENGVDNYGKTLTIDTTIPVKIKKLKITGGYASDDYGAGLSVLGNSEVYLEEGTLISGNTSDAAAAAIGVNDAATVTMNGGSIENNTSLYEYESGNYSGTVLIYKDSSSEASGNPKFILNGGTIKKNKTQFYGGGVGVLSNGKFEMNGGTIGGSSDEDANIADISDAAAYSSGSSTYGGGVFVGSDGSFTMKGGVISHNKALGIGLEDLVNHGQHNNCGGAGVAVCSGGNFEMKAGTLNGVSTKGEISSNTSGRNGGGVYIDSNSTFKMTDGTISGNTSTDEGKGVFLYSSDSVFKMGGSAIVQPDGTGANDVYLPDGATIKVTYQITGGIGYVAVITPATYSNTTTVLEPVDNVSDLSAEYMCFAVTPQIESNVTTEWEIDETGKLKQSGGGNWQGSVDDHDYVDLGLPSGTKWAKMNYSATSETAIGYTGAWSSTNLIELNWGIHWTMPTQTQITELYQNCYFESVDSYNDVEKPDGATRLGYVVYLAKNENDKEKIIGFNADSDDIEGTYSISDPHFFLPAIDNSVVRFWTSTEYDSDGTKYPYSFNIEAQYEPIEYRQASEESVYYRGVVKKDEILVEGTTYNSNYEHVGNVENDKSGDLITVPNLMFSSNPITQYEFEQYMTYYGVITNDSSIVPTESSEDIKKQSVVYYVSWIDAVIYCNLRSKAEGLTPVYKIQGESDVTAEDSPWTLYYHVAKDSNNKYYFNSNDNDEASSYDTESMTFTIDLSANGYRLPTTAEYSNLANYHPELLSGYDEWCQNYYYDYRRCWFNHEINKPVNTEKYALSREVALTFRVVRKVE